MDCDGAISEIIVDFVESGGKEFQRIVLVSYPVSPQVVELSLPGTSRPPSSTVDIMPKSRASRGILLTSNLPQLQNLIKRDPISYREEFLTQYNHYLSLLRLLQHSPLAFSNDSGTAGDGTIKSSSNSSTSNGQHFRELVTFISQVAQCYPEETKTFPKELGDLLMEDGKIGGSGGARGIGNDTRRSIVQNLVMLRNKGVTTSQQYVYCESRTSLCVG